MIDSISFRGKSIDDNKWVYGYLLVSDDSKKVFIVQRFNPSDSSLICSEVFVDTVGQFVETMAYKNQTVYEGDFVKYDTEDGIVLAQIVRQKEAKEYSKWLNGFAYEIIETHEYDNDESVEFEIVGNVHDNPEILNQ